MGEKSIGEDYHGTDRSLARYKHVRLSVFWLGSWFRVKSQGS